MSLLGNYKTGNRGTDARYEKFHKFFCAYYSKDTKNSDTANDKYLKSTKLKDIYEKELFKTLSEDKTIQAFLSTYDLNIKYLKSIYYVVVDLGGNYNINGNWLPIIILTNTSYLSYIHSYIQENELNELFQIKSKITTVVGSCLMNISNGRKLN